MVTVYPQAGVAPPTHGDQFGCIAFPFWSCSAMFVNAIAPSAGY